MAMTGWHVLIELFRNTADIGFYIIVMNYLCRYLFRLQRSGREWLTGIMFGTAGMLSMQFPVLFAEGVMLDLKVVTAAMAAMLGGARGGTAAVLLIGGYRAALGGAGAGYGAAAVVTAALLGAAFHYAERRRRTPFGRMHQAVLGLALALEHVLWANLMPGPIADRVVRYAAIPMLAVYPAALLAFRQFTIRQFRPLLHPFLEIHNLSTLSAETHTGAHHRRTTVMLVHIDNYPNMNDLYGYSFGEKLLLQMHDRLRRRFAPPVLLRVGMNQFLLVLREKDGGEPHLRLMEVRSELSAAYPIQSVNVSVSLTIGITEGSEKSDTLVTLVKQAESALQQARDKGFNQTVYYSPDMADRIVYRSQLQEALRHALPGSEFTLNLQPQFETGSSRLRGFEALLRWRHPRLGNISPAEFIPMAEKSGDIVAIGSWVLAEACKAYVENVLPHCSAGTMSVNISAVQLADPSFPETVAHILNETGLPPEHLELEITESALMASVETAGACMARLAGIGVRFALDDFGTGYSSLNYLQMFPIHLVKIDKSFIQDINGSKSHITESIIQFIHRLNLPVVAEGLETSDQYDTLRRWNCDIVQGYLFSRPFPAAELGSFMSTAAAR